MNKICILFLAIGFSFIMKCNSQISFVEGYYINNSNQKINCLIKNVDWKNNPQEFEYQKTEQAEKKILKIKSVKEFGINNVSKYIRSIVNIDRSGSHRDNLSKIKNPIFKKEELFLKVLIEGDASLLLYNDKSITRYFYKTTNKDIEQLVFKEYKITESKIGSNNEFRRQLYNNLNCSGISTEDVMDIDYKKESLLKFFTKYNNCINSKYVNFEEKQKKDLFNLSIRPGLNSSSLSISNLSSSTNPNYDNQLTFRLGLEFEFILGFNKNKWAVILEPTYQYFKAESNATAYLRDANIDYSSIELPIGIRHYLFLNDNSKIFINSAVIYDILINKKVGTLNASSQVNLAVGVGYNYKNRYSLELRTQTNKDILKEYQYLGSDYKTISIIFGYSIF